jgi:hypothetical protein
MIELLLSVAVKIAALINLLLQISERLNSIKDRRVGKKERR